jgi:hypothetical protein
MNEQDRPDDAIDRLVRRFLESEEARVDADALMEGLERRRSRRRLVRLSLRLCAAAAAVLIAVALLVHRNAPTAPRPAPRQMAAYQPGWQETLQEELVSALRKEVEAALRGARSSGVAAVNAGAAPLMEVAQANRRLPGLIDEAGSAVDRFLQSTNPRPDQTQKEDPQWKL